MRKLVGWRSGNHGFNGRFKGVLRKSGTGPEGGRQRVIITEEGV